MTGSHASTLDRLYAWEKKLYLEVKVCSQMTTVLHCSGGVCCLPSCRYFYYFVQVFLSRNESVSNIVSSFVPIFLVYFMKYLHEKPVVKGIHFLELGKCRLLKAESVLEIQPKSCAF
jgi:hypothetical protein